MNPTITKLERRVARLEEMLGKLVDTYHDPASAHSHAPMNRAIKRAEKLLDRKQFQTRWFL